jgi:hypothetical protein
MPDSPQVTQYLELTATLNSAAIYLAGVGASEDDMVSMRKVRTAALSLLASLNQLSGPGIGMMPPSAVVGAQAPSDPEAPPLAGPPRTPTPRP